MPGRSASAVGRDRREFSVLARGEDGVRRMLRLGVVSFLNARPLVEGLERVGDVTLRREVPARLTGLLDRGEADAALVPIIDLLAGRGRYRVVSDACIGCDGETMTVRVFSQVPPDGVRRLRADRDSHTSVALARVLWRELHDRDIEVAPLDGSRAPAELGPGEAVLLIGDKVVDPQRAGFAYETDLGGAWRAHTGLPFVFALWATQGAGWSAAPAMGGAPAAAARAAERGSEPAGETVLRDRVRLAALLSAARDRGVARAEAIAREEGPRHGWPVELAVRYLTRCLTYRLDGRHVQGANLFARLCGRAGLAPPGAKIDWPAEAPGPAARVQEVYS